MAVNGVCYTFTCSVLQMIWVGADDTETMSGSKVTVIILSYQVKKDIPVLLIARFGTVLFVYTSLDSISLFNLTWLPYAVYNHPIVIMPHGLYIHASGIVRDIATLFMGSGGYNWLLKVNSGWHCSYNLIMGVVMSLTLGKPFSTTAALSGCIALFTCIDLTDFIDFLAVFLVQTGMVLWKF